MPTRGIYNETGQGGNYDQWPAVWKGAVAVAPGDLCFFDSSDGYHKPVSSYTWNTDIATTAGTLNAVFAGVSTARRLATQTTDGGVPDGGIIHDGEFCYDCAALGAAVNPGALVTFTKDAAGNFVSNTIVATTATIGQAIGRVTRPAAAGQTCLYFKMLTPLLYGGPTAAA
jgi:hypothetical protein